VFMGVLLGQGCPSASPASGLPKSCHALSGLHFLRHQTQGFALGWYARPFQGRKCRCRVSAPVGEMPHAFVLVPAVIEPFTAESVKQPDQSPVGDVESAAISLFFKEITESEPTH